MAFRSAVVTFPGSNCDRDMAVALEKVSGAAPLRVWHGDAELPEGLGFSGIEDVRVGRLIELDVAATTSDADLEAMCRQLLANQVIENYRIEKPETVQ